MATKINIDTQALGITFSAGTDYRIEAEQGFVVEDGNNETPSPANASLFTFTTNSTGPTISSTTPAANATGVGNATTVTLTFNRYVTKTGATGNFKLYKSPSTLLATINASDSKVTTSGNNAIINISGLITEPVTGYYFNFESNFIRDLDGLQCSATASNISFTTASAPYIISTSPSDGATAVTNNQTMTFTWSWPVTANVGSIDMYETGSPAVLIHSFDVTDTDEVTFSGANMVLDVSPYANNIDKTYYYLLDDELVKDSNTFKSEAVTDVNAYRYTMTPGPVLEASIPINGATGVNENQTVVLDFDQTIELGTGNIYIYRVGSPSDTIIYSIDVATSNRISIADNLLNINVTGQFQRNQTYYFKTDAGVVTDQWGFRFRGITTTTAVRFTMSNSNSLMEVTDSTVTRRFISNTVTSTTNLFAVQEFDDAQDGFTYTLSGAAGFSSSVKKYGTHSFYPNQGYLKAVPDANINHTGDFTIEFWYRQPSVSSGYIMDTRTSTNTNEFNILNSSYNIEFRIGNTELVTAGVPNLNQWYHIAIVRQSGTIKIYRDGTSIDTGSNTSTFDIYTQGLFLGANYLNSFPVEAYIDDFSIETWAKYTANFTAPTAGLVANEEVSIIGFNFDLVGTSYYGVRKRINNYAPVISDLNIDSGLTYSVTLIAGRHKFSYNGSTPDYTLTLSGTKSSVNTQLQTVLIHPQSTYGNEYVTYIQRRNGEIREQEEFLIQEVGTAPTASISETLYVYSTTGTFTPPSDLLALGMKADILIVGGGGGGAIGGGAGGQVIKLTNQTLTNQSYSITIGSGGARGTGGPSGSPAWSDGTAGSATTAFSQTANGGQGGKAFGYPQFNPATDPSQASSFIKGGNITPYVGGNGWQTTYFGYMAGGGGASSSANGGAVANPGSPATSITGGVGAAGDTNTIYPGEFGRGGNGGVNKNPRTGTGVMGTSAGAGGAGGAWESTNPLSGDGKPKDGLKGIVVIRFYV